MKRFDVIVVGGGVAAGAVAGTLREELGSDRSIAVICGEPHVPYTRPGLTKQILRGERPETRALAHPPEWYPRHDVTVLTGETVVDVDRLGRTVRLAGRSLAYDTLVLATGAEPRRIPGPPQIDDRMHVIRSFEDAAEVREHLGTGIRWGVVGGGFIGAEFAASARMRGDDVVLAFPEETTMERALGPVAGSWVARRLAARGVDIRSGAGVTELAADGGRPVLLLDDGSREVVDRVIVGIGVTPQTGLAAQCRLDLAEGGVATDASFRTSDPHIFAIGDIAAWASPLHGGRRVRVEHVDTARAHGEHVARVIEGPDPGPFRELPYFFSGLGDWAFIEHVSVGSGGEGVRREGLDDDALSVAQIDDSGALVAMTAVGAPDDLDAARRILTGDPRPVMNRDRLATSSVPLDEAVSQHTTPTGG